MAQASPGFLLTALFAAALTESSGSPDIDFPRVDSSRLVVVTGGEGDLARVIARAFTDSSCQVLALSRKDLDVLNPEAVRQYFRELPRLDLLVNNAGITRDGVASKLAEDDWDAVLDTNLRGAFLCSQAAIERMGTGGHIVQIGSYSGRSGPVGQAAYAASKSGLVGLTTSLAREWGPSGIRVNCVLPGFLETRMTQRLDPAVRERVLKAHCLGRFNTPADVARFLVFLDSMTAVSGQTFQLDSRISGIC